MRRHSDLHQSAAISAVLLVLLFALPLAVVVPFQTELFSDDPIAVESEREPFQPGDLDGEMVLKVLAGDTVEEMTLGEYLVGVVRAEMPASFEPEALKAQAGGPDEHPVQDADRRQPRRHRGHLHGLHLLPGVYLGGKRPEQLGRERGRL